MSHKPSPFRVKIDRQAGTGYIYVAGPIGNGEAARQIHAGKNFVLDLDKYGRLLGIEILDMDAIHLRTVFPPKDLVWPDA
jgi:uncharacterized protein YuzE